MHASVHRRQIKWGFATKLARFQMIRAFFFAFAASHTFVFIKHHLGLRGLAFGIMAPGALKVAPFEKDRCADARTVGV